MATVANYKQIALLSKAPEVIEVEYDFDKDAGAVGNLDLFVAKSKLIIHRVWIKGVTSLTSAGAATVSVGKSGDVAGLVAATAYTDLAADEVAFGAAPATGDASFVVAVDGIVQMAIGTAALTAGKFKVCVEASLL